MKCVLVYPGLWQGQETLEYKIWGMGMNEYEGKAQALNYNIECL